MDWTDALWQVRQRGHRLVWGLGDVVGADPWAEFRFGAVGTVRPVKVHTKYKQAAQSRTSPVNVCLIHRSCSLCGFTVFQDAQLLCCIVGYAVMRLVL